MIGFGLPATLEVMNNPRLLAQISTFFETSKPLTPEEQEIEDLFEPIFPLEHPRLEPFLNDAAVLMIQVSCAAVNKQIQRIKLEKEVISLQTLAFLREDGALSYEEMMAHVPQLETLVLDAPVSNMQELAQALRSKCPKFKVLEIQSWLDRRSLNAAFEGFAQEITNPNYYSLY